MSPRSRSASRAGVGARLSGQEQEKPEGERMLMAGTRLLTVETGGSFKLPDGTVVVVTSVGGLARTVSLRFEKGGKTKKETLVRGDKPKADFGGGLSVRIDSAAGSKDNMKANLSVPEGTVNITAARA